MTIGIIEVASLAGRVVVGPVVTMTSTLRRTSSAASAGSRSSFPSAYRHSTTMFFLSTYPSSRKPCRNASMRSAIAEKVAVFRCPIRGIFAGCCAQAAATTTTSTKANIENPSHFGFWIADFRLWERDFEGNAFIGLFSQLSIQNLKSKMLFDHPVRPRQHFLWYRHADLLCRLHIDHQLELRRLLDRQIGRLCSLQDLVHVVCDAPVAFREVRPVGHEPTAIYSFSAIVRRR